MRQSGKALAFKLRPFRSRQNNVAFVKGKSGNPGGRPKEAADVKALAREYTTEAVEKFIHLMRNGEDERTQLAAASALMDRAYGKPAQALEHTGGVNINVNIGLKSK